MIARWRPSWHGCEYLVDLSPNLRDDCLDRRDAAVDISRLDAYGARGRPGVVSLRRGEEYGDGSQVDAPFQIIKLALELFQCWQPAKAGHYYEQILIWAISKVNLASLGG